MLSKWKMRLGVSLLLVMAGYTQGYSQTEMEPWGNITGIRVNGQLMDFETSLQVVSNDWKSVKATALERQRPKYGAKATHRS